ncbi:hypothetical protein [Burkholderia pyrrocinia]|uniref:hypothetical protein n=1 Tax=Burkholderia pyrrocinia TaxID=60550 RepID=UPI002AB06101|nr:hypothetical protein [Burkholderia pyrrocinia]
MPRTSSLSRFNDGKERDRILRFQQEITFLMHPSAAIEILISDSRSISNGSQFGHAAISIDGVVYGRAHPGWDVDNVLNYLNRQQSKMRRDTIGYLINTSGNEKKLSLMK